MVVRIHLGAPEWLCTPNGRESRLKPDQVMVRVHPELPVTTKSTRRVRGRRLKARIHSVCDVVTMLSYSNGRESRLKSGPVLVRIQPGAPSKGPARTLTIETQVTNTQP